MGIENLANAANNLAYQSLLLKNKLKAISLIALGIIFAGFSFFTLVAAKNVAVFLVSLALGIIFLILGILGLSGRIWLVKTLDYRRRFGSI